MLQDKQFSLRLRFREYTKIALSQYFRRILLRREGFARFALPRYARKVATLPGPAKTGLLDALRHARLQRPRQQRSAHAHCTIMPTTRTLYPHQQRGIDLGVTLGRDPLGPPPHRLLLAAPTGCHARGTEVLRANGESVRVEDVRVGDRLAGRSGPVTVLSLARGRQEMARVVPRKGASFVVNLDHILTLRWTGGSGNSGLVDVSVRDWLKWSRYRKHCAKLVRCPVEHFDGEAGELPIEPWFLGALLGDGSLAGTPSVTKPDEEVLVACEAAASRAGLAPNRRGRGGCPVVSFPSVRKGGSANPLTTALRALGLWGRTAGDKFIPPCYRTASRDARLALLAGLLDTDGHLTSGCYDVVFKSEQLARDTVFVARSLGLAAYIQPKESWCQTGAGGVYWRVSLSGETGMIPLRLARKRAAPRRQKKDALCTGFHVELLSEDDYFGFHVDGDQRYLLADFTLTHNSGKSLIATGIQAALTEAGVRCAVLSSRLDILLQIAEKRGITFDHGTSETRMLAALDAAGLWTPLRYLNALQAGRCQPYDVGVLDEGHHSIAESWSAVADTMSKAVALTATPYRGTPRGSAALYEEWGRPVWLVTLRECVAAGITSMPRLVVCPLLDDDQAEVSAGEFTEASLDALIEPKLDAILTDVQQHRRPGRCGVLVLPSRRLAGIAAEELPRRGVSAVAVTGETPKDERPAIYAAARRGDIVLVTVQVLSEGVDLPVEDLFCARPMRSPVAAMQLWGRATRPNLAPVIRDYSRNVERFAYLWDGLLPPSVVADAQKGFGKPSTRAAARALDIESVARLKRLPIPLAGGAWAEGYMLQRTGSDDTSQWAVIYVPWLPDPVVARRDHNRAQWRRATIPAGLDGYGTSTARFPASPKQAEWWKRDAAKVGLDPDVRVDMRTFAFLPALLQSYQHVRAKR